MKFLMILGILMFLGLASATANFTIPTSQIHWMNSTLNNVAEITDELYADITNNGTWHYYAVTKQGGGSLNNLHEIIPNGFKVRDARIIKAAMLEGIGHEQDMNTTCDEHGVCNDTIFNRTFPTTTFIEDNKWDVRLIGIKTDNFATGNFNPNVSGCGTLSSANTYYTMNTSLVKYGGICFTISADNITLDCMGYNITGNLSGGAYGIRISSTGTNAKIINCNVYNFTEATRLNGASNVIYNGGNYTGVTQAMFVWTSPVNLKIYNVAASGGIGLSITTVNTLEMENVTGIGNGTSTGIRIVDSAAIRLNMVNGTSTAGNGISIITSSQATIGNSTGESQSAYGIYVDTSNLTNILNSNASATTGYATFLYRAKKTAIKDLKTTATSGNALQIYTSHNTTATNMTATSTGGAAVLFFGGSTENMIANSTLTSDTGTAAQFVSSNERNTITNCTLLSNSTTVYFQTSSSYNNITASAITGSGGNGAVEIAGGSAYNTIADNRINGTTTFGVGMLNGENDNNIIRNNTFVEGVFQIANDYQASGNIIYWNNFTNIGNPVAYVYDLSGENNYSYYIGGKYEGNIYENVMNLTVNVSGTSNSTGFPTLYTGIYGSGYPYNYTTSLGMFDCQFAGCQDGSPLTTQFTPCITSISWQPGMTPDGLIITRYTDDATTWLAQFVKVESNIGGCIENTTAYGTTKNTSVFGTVTSTSTGNLTLNHTNVPVNNTIILWSTLFLNNGTNITLAAREYYIIALPSRLGENMVGEILILAGVAMIYIAFRKKEGD